METTTIVFNALDEIKRLWGIIIFVTFVSISFTLGGLSIIRHKRDKTLPITRYIHKSDGAIALLIGVFGLYFASTIIYENKRKSDYIQQALSTKDYLTEVGQAEIVYEMDYLNTLYINDKAFRFSNRGLRIGQFKNQTSSNSSIKNGDCIKITYLDSTSSTYFLKPNSFYIILVERMAPESNDCY